MGTLVDKAPKKHILEFLFQAQEDIERGAKLLLDRPIWRAPNWTLMDKENYSWKDSIVESVKADYSTLTLNAQLLEIATQQARQLFASARYELFEDGMDSAFSNAVLSLIEKYGEIALEAISSLIMSQSVATEAAGEALKCVAHIRDRATVETRMRLLKHALRHKSALVRDSAALGLASIDDPRAMPDIQRAIARESVDELRRAMVQVLEQLKETAREPM